MTDLICLDCENYNISKEYCYKIQAIIPCTDESGALSTCMHHKKKIQKKCNTCRHYDFSTKKCFAFNQIVVEDIQILSCNRYEQTSIKQGDIFWGKDEHTTDRWWMCHLCHTWFKEKDNHYCSVVIQEEPPFISEKEMQI